MSGVTLKTKFVCHACRHEEMKWFGRCPSCGEWGTLDEQVADVKQGKARRGSSPLAVIAQPIALADIPAEQGRRDATGIPELDRTLGGGLVPGMVVLLGGAPGIGKSTLLLQMAEQVARSGKSVLYVSGEESPGQIKLRAARLRVTSEMLKILGEHDVEAVVEHVRRDPPALLLIDSIQAVHSPELRSIPGSVAQVRECAHRFVELAKALHVPTVLVGHVTKDGSIAGPRTLEHAVDTVLHFEGERHHTHRILRTVKNRFGTADALGVFKMTGLGLEGITSPSEAFLAEKPRQTPGSVVLAALEGARPMLVEVQALVGDPTPGNPRRTSIGVDGNRVALILAILQRAVRLDVADRDVFVNVTGGLTIQEPAADLAVAMAITSAALGKPVPDDWVVAGELGLTGEIRTVTRLDARLEEASRLGFRCAVIPPMREIDPQGETLKLISSTRVEEAISRTLSAPIRSGNRRPDDRA